jgi:glycosyltransferase involved in cell wall biosynthesis
MTDAERPYIEDAINSVVNQTYRCELVVLLNDQSVLFDDLYKKYPEINFIKSPIRPLGEMRNFGLNYVETEWVAYLDGDDIWYPNKIKEQLSCAKMSNADFVGCDHYLISEGGVRCACSVSHNIPMPSSWLVKRELMSERKFSNARICEDGEWWVKNIKSIGAVRMPNLGLGYRVRGNSLSNNTSSKKRKWLMVRFASVPILREFIFTATWIVNRSTRSNYYKWLDEWGGN